MHVEQPVANAILVYYNLFPRQELCTQVRGVALTIDLPDFYPLRLHELLDP